MTPHRRYNPLLDEWVELTAEPQRDLTAEDAALRLRAQAETHYLRG